MKLKVEKGRAIILTGPEGTGKGIIAKRLALNAGSRIVTTQMVHLKSDFGLGSVTLDNPETVIVDEFNPSLENLAFIKTMLCNDSIVVNRKFKEPVTVPSPNFILITNRPIPLLGENERRFFIVEL